MKYKRVLLKLSGESLVQENGTVLNNMLLKGNLGSNSYEKITKEINSNKNIRYLIRNNEDNWQIPKDIISFTKMNKKKIDEIGVYDVYSD